MKKLFKAIIIEDEVNNAKLLSHFLDSYCKEVLVEGIAANLEEAEELISKTSPDIVFTDVVLKNELAIDLFDVVDPAKFQIIFTTAHQEYASKAFRLNAADYLTKPINIQHLKDAVQRAILNIENKALQEENNNIENNKRNDSFSDKIISIHSKNEVILVKVDDIIYLNSERKYTIFHMINGSQYVSTNNLGHYEKSLNLDYFVRIHNSYIINLHHLTKVSKSDGNFCVLKNGKSLPISRRRFTVLKEILNL